MNPRHVIAMLAVAALFAAPTAAAEDGAVDLRIRCEGEPTGIPLIDNLFQNTCSAVADLCDDIFRPCILE